MNTIPSIFNEKITQYTAVGGRERIACTGLSAVILNRPGIIRRSFFQEIEKIGFDNVISIETCAPHYDIEELSGRFPFVRFIIPEKEINLGEQINIAALEVQSHFFFVIRNDMKIVTGGTSRRMAQRLVNIKEDVDPNEKIIPEIKRLCTVPVLMNYNYVIIPSVSAPVINRRKMQSVFLQPQNEGDLSLYPFDGVGIYDKKRFISMGGFDTALNKPHWQLMDFGFRAHLWGEEIALDINLKLLYDGELPVENSTIEESYRRFYLKNLAPVFHSNKLSVNYADLPFYRFFPFARNCGEDIFSAWKEFQESKKWVIDNKFRFKCDARNVACKWDNSN